MRESTLTIACRSRSVYSVMILSRNSSLRTRLSSRSSSLSMDFSAMLNRVSSSIVQSRKVSQESLVLGLPEQAHTLVVVLLADLILGTAVELVVDIIVVAFATPEMETPHHFVVASDESVHDLLDATLDHCALGVELDLLEFHGRSPYYSAPRSSRASPASRSLLAREAGAQVGARTMIGHFRPRPLRTRFRTLRRVANVQA